MNFRDAFTLLLVTGSVCLCFQPVQAQDRYTLDRQRMVDEFIVAEGVKDPRVIEAMRTVPRHLFVTPQTRPFAYFDQALDLGFKQTISPPFIVAYMTEILEPDPNDKVLEIGTGSGYQAAVLSGLVKDVYTIEIVEPLGERTQKLLRRQGYDNVHTRIGDGYLGWPEAAPFDKIIVTCSPENVPQPLIEQLKEGGRMIIPLGERYQQVFYLFEKQNGELKQTQLIPTLFVPMTGQMEELRNAKPDPLNPQISNSGFEVDSNEDGLADGWHYQRRSTLVDNAYAGAKAIQFENDVPGRMAHILQGFAIDGSKVSRATLSWAMKTTNINRGQSTKELPGITLHFFDAKRIPIGQVTIGPWISDEPEWKALSRTIDIPRGAREAILQAGLNGATGTLALDELILTPLK